jgi:hypothetical protein
MIRLLALQKAADRIAATSGFEKCMIGRQHPSCVDAFCGAMNAIPDSREATRARARNDSASAQKQAEPRSDRVWKSIQAPNAAASIAQVAIRHEAEPAVQSVPEAFT